MRRSALRDSNDTSGRANQLPADLFLSIHHDSVPTWLLEKWDYEGQERGFSDRFSGHSIFVSALNPEFKEVYVSDMRLNGVMTFSAPEVFEPVAAPAPR